MFSLPRILIVSVLMLGIAFLSSAQAASACKGLSKSSCGGNSSCTWVDGYTRKDGKKVSAYCRSVSKKKSDSKKTTQTPAKKSASDNKKSTKDAKNAKQNDKKPVKKNTKADKKPAKKESKKSTKDTKKSSKDKKSS